jgi:hypothetical protein
MTPKEHALMVTILSTQLALNKAVMEILNSRGLVENGDLAAFLALVREHQNASGPLAEAARQLYVSVAQRLGVVTGLEDPQGTL